MKTTAESEIANKREHVGSLRHAVPNGVASTLLEQYEASLAIARERFDQHATMNGFSWRKQ